MNQHVVVKVVQAKPGFVSSSIALLFFGVVGACVPTTSTPLELDGGTLDEAGSSSGTSGTSGDVGGTSSGGTSSGGTSSGGTSSGGTSSGGDATNCIKATNGLYVIRNDGKLLVGTDNTVIVDAANGQPLANVTSATNGGTHGCASTSDGKAYCWRNGSTTNSNDVGQLGSGTKGDTGGSWRATPVLMAAGKPLTGVTSVGRLGDWRKVSCAVAGGKAYCWGDLTWLVNNGSDLSSPYAQPITDGTNPLSGVQQIAYGRYDACVLIANGSTNEVWCWGSGDGYGLGQGDTVKHQYPVRVLGLTHPTAVSVGGSTSCAADDGHVKCWGSNSNGACGNGQNGGYCVNPATVIGPSGNALDGVVDLVSYERNEGSSNHSCVLRNDQTVWCWGVGVSKATNVGIPNATQFGTYGVVTDDGVYHLLDGTDTIVPNCGAL